MRQLILLIHISLDGFVADAEGKLDKFPQGQENLDFVVDLTKNADATLNGRKSFQMLEQFWPSAADRPGASKGEIAYSNWYNQAKKIVASRTLDADNNSIQIVNDNLLEEVIRLKSQPGKDILIFGSPSLIPALMEAGLIDVYWIFVNPVFFGQGIPAFKNQIQMQNLKHTATHQLTNGEVALQYLAKGQ